MASAHGRDPVFSRSWAVYRGVLALCTALSLALIWVIPPVFAFVAVGASLALAAILRWPVSGFVLLVFSIPWASGASVPVAGFAVTATDVLVAILAATWMIQLSVRGQEALVVTPWTPYIVLFILALAASASQAADWHASLREIVKWIELLVVFQCGIALIRTRVELQVLVAALVAAGVSQALLGYVQFGFQLGPEAFAHGVFLRAYGTFDQPNPYAGYLNMVFPLAFALSLAPGDRISKRLYGTAAALIVGGLLVSESRGALLATVCAVAVVLSLHSRVWYRLTWVGVLLGLAGGWFASLGVVPTSPFVRLLSTIGLGDVSFGNVNNANFSAVERAAHWLAGVRMFADHPILGVGIGNYANAYPAYHPRGWYAALAHAHDYYINVAAEAGIFGLASYLLLAGLALWYSYATVRRLGDHMLSAVVLGVLGALAATDFHNLFDVLYVHGLVVLLGILMSFVPATQLIARDKLLTLPATI